MLTHGQSTNLWMNECHTNFAFSYKIYVLNVFSMQEMYKLWMNEFCKIFIIKSWNIKFVMMGCDGSWNHVDGKGGYESKMRQMGGTWCMHHGKGSKHELKHVHFLGMPTYASKHALDTPQNLHHHLYPIIELIFEEIRIIVCEHSFG
jgi:hypothetical protein